MPTFSPDRLLAVRLGNARPGLEMATFVDAALPVAVINADVLAQDSKRLPLLQEFVLRLVDGKVTDEKAIAGILGLPTRMVERTAGELFGTDDLRWTFPRGQAAGPARNLGLTDRGTRTARELASFTPVRVTEALAFDLMLRKVRPYQRRALSPRRQANSDGAITLPATSSPVEAGDVSAADITALLREKGHPTAKSSSSKRSARSKPGTPCPPNSSSTPTPTAPTSSSASSSTANSATPTSSP
jgi:hypothetical protein